MKRIYQSKVLLWALCLLSFSIWAQDESRYDLPYYSEPGILPAPASSATHTPSVNNKPANNKTVQTTTAKTVAIHHQTTQLLSQKRYLSHFAALDIDGPFRVTVAGGSRSKPSVDLNGDPRAMARVSSVVVNGALVLRMRPAPPEEASQKIFYNPWIIVKINSNGPLSSVRLGGPSRLSGYGVTSSGLTLITQDQASVNLEGNLHIDSILDNSSGSISLSQVSGDHLSINGFGANRLFLAGRVDILDAHLGGAIRLAAMQLPARLVYVQTQDNASAEVWPVRVLYAFASGNSNIFYTHVPAITAGHSQNSGNILRLR